MTNPHVRVELISDPTYLCGARELVAAIARRLGFTEEDCGQLALAVDEALCNVMRHGYDRRTDGRIWLSLLPMNGPDASAPDLKVVIEDEAKQVEPENIVGRDLDDIRPGGLGVHIIQKVMDNVRYEKRDSRGMRLTMIKRGRTVKAESGAVGCHV